MQVRSFYRVPMMLALAVGVTVMPTLAAPAERGTELGFDVGRLNFASDVSDDEAVSFGLRGGYHFNKVFQLEGQLTSSEADDTLGDVRLNTMFVNGLYNFSLRQNKIRPYLMAGVGQANLEFEGSGLKFDDTDMAYQVGAGSRFAIGKTGRLAARLEVVRLREETFGQGSNYTNVTTGLSWRLGHQS